MEWAEEDVSGEEEEPIYIKKDDGSVLTVKPERLKRRFQHLLQKYQLNAGNNADRIADFMIGGAQGVTSEQFAAEFNTSVDDAEAVMTWINVGLAWKEHQASQARADGLGERLGLPPANKG